EAADVRRQRESRFLCASEYGQLLPPHPGPLPQGEGESQPDRAKTKGFGCTPDLEKILPLPEGEGRGEGEATVHTAHELRHSDFGLLSHFDLRISDFLAPLHTSSRFHSPDFIQP